MAAQTTYDYWLVPEHEKFVGEILASVESIKTISRSRRQERRQKTNQVRQDLRTKINGIIKAGDAQYISNFYTVVSRLAQINMEGDKDQEDIWRDLFEDFRPNYLSYETKGENFLPRKDVLEALPEGSWLLSLKLTLQEQYTSKDESDFHFSNNPIVRDTMTGFPMVRPTTWKGHLRFAARRDLEVQSANEEPPAIKRLFGESRGEEGGRQGRLHFFPTFFTQSVKREVITPLKRDTRTPARGPIDVEVVPPGATGIFSILYLSHPRGKSPSWTEVAEDLATATSAMKSMFLKYGFSAKKTAGWGVIEDAVQDGELWARWSVWPEADQQSNASPIQAPDAQYLALMNAAGDPLPQLRKSDESFLSNNEFQALPEKPTSLSVYRAFRSWYTSHGEAWRRAQADDSAALPSLRTYPFPSITNLNALAKDLVEKLRLEVAND